MCSLFLRIQTEKRSWSLCDRKRNLLFDHLTLLWYLQGDIGRFTWNQNFSKTWKRRQMVHKFPRKVSVNSGNCWISEMEEPLNRKTPRAKLNGKKTCWSCWIQTRRFDWMKSAFQSCFPGNSCSISSKQSLRLSRSFFGKWDSFVQMINANPGEIYQSFLFAYHLPGNRPVS